MHLSKFSNPSLTAIKESDQRVRTALLRGMVCQGKRLCEKEAELPVWGCVGLCGDVWGCVGHAAGGGNRIARAKGGLGEASRETLLQDAQKCSPTHETMAIGILSMSKKPTPQ